MFISFLLSQAFTSPGECRLAGSHEARNRLAGGSTRLFRNGGACLATDATNESESTRFRILGALEAEAGDHALEFGGGKQRAVLAALLLRADEAVPVERLVGEIWGDSPPPSAAHSLEVYVSRLRKVLAPHGVSLERGGGGYRIVLGEAGLDARAFEELVEEASEAASAGDDGRAAALARDALGLWRGPVLAGVPLYGEGRTDAERLEELRVRTLEVRIGADLALGRHSELVSELRQLVEENPYRERHVAQLMVALYRSGRQAEALEAYERTRRVLMDDLGIQPSPELQQLSGQIVRHEPDLAVPAPVVPVRAEPVRSTRRRRVIPALAVAVVAVLVGVGAGLAWGIGGGAADPTAAGTRVALVVPRPSTPGREDAFVMPFVDGLFLAAQKYALDTKTFVLNGSSSNFAQRLQGDDGFDLVLSAGLDPASSALPEAARRSDTRFVYIDASVRGTRAESNPNATGLRFADEKAGYLAGYLSGLMAPRPVVSVVGGPGSPAVDALVRGFARGAREARPGIAVLIAHTSSTTDQAVCERIANHQIDRGSTVVFAAAGTCGFGALSAAGLRGVWGVGSDADRSYLGSHILVSTVKRIDRAIEMAVRWFVQGSLPEGDVVLGLDDDAVGISGISRDVPPEIRKQVAAVAAALRAAESSPRP
jgi:DNA-binding SARP family transcriptional activator/basic membrane lipoprotein Med (substrate-binding protein (PBP1-ABC) superfamily)